MKKKGGRDSKDQEGRRKKERKLWAQVCMTFLFLHINKIFLYKLHL